MRQKNHKRRMQDPMNARLWLSHLSASGLSDAQQIPLIDSASVWREEESA
jgi:hypothetical protein